MTGPREPTATARLAAIRLAIFAGVLAFGLFAFWQHRQPGWVRANPHDLKPVKWVGMGAWSLAVIGVIGLRLRYTREAETGSNPRISMIAWALGELPALFGAMYYFLTDDATIYLAGIGALVVSFSLFPAARR